jgi:hypothetical protein
MPRNAITPRPFVNDDLTAHATGAGEWSLPSEPDSMQEPAHIQRSTFDYSDGMFVKVTDDEQATIPGNLHPIKLLRRTDVPPSYQVPHEATHRRYEPPFTQAINQAAAGFTLITPPRSGLHYVKVIAAFLTLDAAGTVRFVQGSTDGLSVADLSGNFACGGANNAPLQLQPAEIETPWFYTASDQALGIFTVTGKAQGFVTYCFSPYES